MIICERCGKEVPDNAAICPACGTISPLSRPASTSYGPNPPSSVSYEYSQGYDQQAIYAPQPDYPQQPAYPSPPVYPQQPGYAPQSGYGQPYNMPPSMYPPAAVNINVAVPVATGNSNSSAVVVEVLLNLLLSTYGVGWLMAGETTTGIILLICSLVLYLPIVIVVSILTIGLGLICIAPFAIGAVILNAVLLNNKLKQKNMYVMVQTMPPAQPFPRQ